MFNLIDRVTGIGLLALAALPFVSVGAAHAQTAGVRISDLDLRQPAQAATFQVRVDQAADRLCARIDHRDLNGRSACRRAVRAEAMDKLAAHDQLAARTVKVASR